MYVLGSFYVQSHKSKQRIKQYSVGDLSNHSQRLKRVGLFEGMEQDMAEHLAGVGGDDLGAMLPTPQRRDGDLLEFGRGSEPDSEHPLLSSTPTSESKDHSPSQPTSVIGTAFSVTLSSSKTAWNMSRIVKERGLSSLQLEMLDNINQIPGLVKHFALFHDIRHSHGQLTYNLS